MNIRMATLPQLLRDHARRSPQRLSQRHKTRGIWREYDFSQVQRNVMDVDQKILRVDAMVTHQPGHRRAMIVKILLLHPPRFDRIDGLPAGADVRLAGVKVGQVVAQRIDPESFLAVLTLRVDAGLRLPTDTSAEIQSEGLLGGKYVALVPGGSDRILRDGQEITITQSAVSLENLLGRFIFSVTEMNQGRGGDQQQPAPAPQPQGSPR